jgi:hypothetical protein
MAATAADQPPHLCGRAVRFRFRAS